jgi:Rod binding domain-containing protein
MHPVAALASSGAGPVLAPEVHAKARAAAQDFEAVFLNSMLQQVFAHTGDGPFGGGAGAKVWRSLLTEEYAKSFAGSGGIGIADHVYRSLIAAQAAPST